MEAHGRAPQTREAEAGQKHAPGGDGCGHRPAAFQGPGYEQQFCFDGLFLVSIQSPAPSNPALRRSGSPHAAPAGGLVLILPGPQRQRRQYGRRSPETPIGGADPDRPRIVHGQQTPTDDFQPAQLTGVPSGLQQMIAVSDASDRETHPFVYLWADPADATKMQEQMEVAAADAIAAAAPPAKTATKPHTAATPAQRRKAATTPPPAPKPVFTNERFKAYELTFSGGATLVFTAETQDHAGKTKYVTLIAQPDFNGVPKVLFKSVTDDDHLDVTPRMRLVDAVDARANNRGDLVFELRSEARSRIRDLPHLRRAGRASLYHWLAAQFAKRRL